MDNYRNWARIYDEIGDGKIPQCARTRCTSSCCSQKKVRGSDGRLTDIPYRTALMGEDEFHYQNEAIGSLEKSGVQVIKIEPADRVRLTPAYVINGCSEDEKVCKLEGRKPFVCRIFPFGFSVKYPLATTCPDILEIFENREIVQRMLRVRRMLGHYDDKEWLDAANRAIEDIRGMIFLGI